MMLFQLQKRNIVIRSRNLANLRLFIAKYPMGDCRLPRSRFSCFVPVVTIRQPRCGRPCPPRPRSLASSCWCWAGTCPPRLSQSGVPPWSRACVRQRGRRGPIIRWSTTAAVVGAAVVAAVVSYEHWSRRGWLVVPPCRARGRPAVWGQDLNGDDHATDT